MRAFILCAIVLCIGSFPAYAQNENLDIVNEPICFQVRNSADFMLSGSIITGEYTRPDGIKTRHRSNFRLEEAGSTNEEGYPDDRAEFCSYGPFMPGRKLGVTVRTLFPVFSCNTRIDQGEIVLKAERKADDSGYNYSATCYE